MSGDLGAATLDAYSRWAPSYPPLAHNPLMRVEQAAMQEHWPAVAGRRVLDLAAGTGRYSRLLAEGHAADVIAVDFCLPMLTQLWNAHRVCASMMQLPFAAAAFDVIIAGLALGHAADLHAWMREVTRVLRPGGTLLYSDFHPAAAERSMTRTFKDQHGQGWQVPHRAFGLASQREAASSAGLTVEIMQELRVGTELRELFPNSAEFYRRWDGLPIVVVVRARK